MSRAFDALVNRAGLPKITLHGLRHTFATLAVMYSEGVGEYDAVWNPAVRDLGDQRVGVGMRTSDL